MTGSGSGLGDWYVMPRPTWQPDCLGFWLRKRTRTKSLPCSRTKLTTLRRGCAMRTSKKRKTTAAQCLVISRIRAPWFERFTLACGLIHCHAREGKVATVDVLNTVGAIGNHHKANGWMVLNHPLSDPTFNTF